MAAWAGPEAAYATVEFLTASISNPNTRDSYARAAGRFLDWCEQHALALHHVTAVHVAAYIEQLGQRVSAPTVKANLAGLRHWFDKLVVAGVLPFSPATSVRGPRFRRQKGATPWLRRDAAAALLTVLDEAARAPAALLALRDRALLAVMLFGFGRVTAVTNMRVRDYLNPGTLHAVLRFHEKRGRVHEVPAHTRAVQALDAWLDASGLKGQPDAPLFPGSSGGINPQLSQQAMKRRAALDVVKRWCDAAGLPPEISNHSLRATGLTMHRKAGGDLRRTQQLAGHADISTTLLYDHSDDEQSRAEVERVQL